jgi:hypothetical protein
MRRTHQVAYQHTNSRGKVYTLHRTVAKVRGSERTLHYFSLGAGPDAIDAVPEGYVVVESERTGLPLLKRKG